MENFSYQNPVEIIFGKGSIARLETKIPKDQKILLCFGSGSVKKNGVYDQVLKALKHHAVIEFWGIEPNPRYETCMEAVYLAKKEKIQFLLSVGGGSVLDGTKFIAAALLYKKGDPWEILSKQAPVENAMPLACVLTLPATGSEMNAFSVVSRDSDTEKLAFSSPCVFPKFSILDPESTYTLPVRQTANGIVDAFIHVMEQYMTYPCNAPLQDRQAEAILKTLIEEGPKALKKPKDYAVRANLMWCATQALNGLINCGVPQDWATHMIGHELTALYGIDHARSLALVFPSLLTFCKKNKAQKLIQFGERIFGITKGTPDQKIEKTIHKIREFFKSFGMKLTLKENKIPPEACALVAKRIEARGVKLGERMNLGEKEITKILKACK